MLTPATQPAMSDPMSIVEQDMDGQRQWSLEGELNWYCYHHSKGQVQAWLNGLLAVHGFVVLDCNSFRRRQIR